MGRRTQSGDKVEEEEEAKNRSRRRNDNETERNFPMES